jgi:hypothetical protein
MRVDAATASIDCSLPQLGQIRTVHSCWDGGCIGAGRFSGLAATCRGGQYGREQYESRRSHGSSSRHVGLDSMIALAAIVAATQALTSVPRA